MSFLKKIKVNESSSSSFSEDILSRKEGSHGSSSALQNTCENRLPLFPSRSRKEGFANGKRQIGNTGLPMNKLRD